MSPRNHSGKPAAELDPPINHPEAVPPETNPGAALPVELLAALTAEQNPYELLGREYARRVQLEGVVAAMQKFLKSVVIPD